MLYTPYRIEDLKSLLPSVSHSGIVYHSKMRVGIGTFQLHAIELIPCSREEIEAVEVYISINIMIVGSNNNCVTSHHRMLALAFHNIIVANILKWKKIKIGYWFYRNSCSQGDSPARAFESGNQVNGHLPCHCGIDIRLVLTYQNLTKPKYLSMCARMEVIQETSRWNDRPVGQISAYDNLNVSDFFFFGDYLI